MKANLFTQSSYYDSNPCLILNFKRKMQGFSAAQGIDSVKWESKLIIRKGVKMKMRRNQLIFLAVTAVLLLMVVCSPSSVVHAAVIAAEGTEQVTEVTGAGGGVEALLKQYAAFAPLLIGIVFIALRRKFFPGKND